MEQELLPVGLRRDGSYYTRIDWASTTESDPTFWVLNLISDDFERNGGTWGANTEGKADVVLSFFGELQKIGKLRIFRNVGLDISILEELVKTINIYVSETDEPKKKLRRKDDQIDSVPWTFIKQVDIEKAEGWQEIVLDQPVSAKYVRIEMLGNHDAPFPWVEMSEVKIYP